jgi:hypothetical protein
MTRRATSAGTKICAASPRQLATEIFEGVLPYFLAPGVVPFNDDWRRFRSCRFGLTILKVPLPRYSAS